MKNKRGTDHCWTLVKYSGDAAIYAECECGHYYACSKELRNEDGSFTFKQIPTYFYPYCSCCGARKKYYSSTIEKRDMEELFNHKSGKILDMSEKFIEEYKRELAEQSE